jgi:APA family basic amino acid/polyamine antiporter
MGKDYQALFFLNSRLKNGGPLSATILQAAIALILILTFSFDSLLTYIGFTLSIFAALTVAGVFLVRKTLQNKWRWGYPFLPLLFIALSLWIVIHSFYDRPFESLTGLVTIAGSLLLYFLLRNNNKRS